MRSDLMRHVAWNDHFPPQPWGRRCSAARASSSSPSVSHLQLSTAVSGRRLTFRWGVHVARVGIMRCMACGGEMILTAVKTDDGGMVAGFKHETLQCSVCRDIEHRFVFGRDSSGEPKAPAASVCPQQRAVCSSQVESSSSPRQSSSPPNGISSSTHEASISCWSRAVEKLRSRQADIRVRDDDKKTDWNARFNQTWEKFAADRKPRAARDATPQLEHLARKSARVLRAELRRSLSAGNRAERPIIEPAAEEIQWFNQFWDSLLPGRHRSDLPSHAVPTILAEPLPRSLSLVRVENIESVTIATRAVTSIVLCQQERGTDAL